MPGRYSRLATPGDYRVVIAPGSIELAKPTPRPSTFYQATRPLLGTQRGLTNTPLLGPEFLHRLPRVEQVLQRVGAEPRRQDGLGTLADEDRPVAAAIAHLVIRGRIDPD